MTWREQENGWTVYLIFLPWKVEVYDMSLDIEKAEGALKHML